MKNIKQTIVISALAIGFIILVISIKRTAASYTKDSTMERCRVNKVIRIDDYQEGRSVYPTEIKWILTTDEGYKVYTRNGNYQVGDSIDIEVIRINNKNQ